MRRDVLRFSGWMVVALLLMLLLASGCTRAKSSAPPTATAIGGAPQAATGTPGVEPSPTPLSGQDEISATSAAWATGTAAAATQPPEDTEAAPTSTAEPTESPAPTTAALTDTPQPSGVLEPTASPLPTAVPSGQVRTHIVKAGENLFRIALSYGMSYERLAAYNGITNPHVIRVGQEIKIPPTGEPGVTPVPGDRYHVVQPGENLFRIALSYGMSYERLAAANGLRYPYTIYVGQRLIIP